ncbi:type I restriction enzyme HsdR N-terminal domain-containing protein [Bremerella sp. P1]|uniref:type I restriction enzyme HsdR N-terminal domain-containing protein n=1 Tax=Bremerella sp. P1 TaxID=3026424 RepID=UPI002367ACAD|nr:type I restriction enzyme HsdR N-terminal domain-containing protein [Bremerella sp. P1]WDI43989.1 type I restriction enzyme HsdR N-terminal domain-containing protein [Bremerella sp. P1]
MDLIDRLKELASRAEKLAPQLKTEEATKNALVMPFIGALGYDVFNPLEVVPEFTADVGIKKGEKVDYAIMQEAQVTMLFECKMIGTDLAKITPSQLYRYFSVTDARFGILTDGVHYQFYSDLDSPNKMDSRPFLDFRITDLSEKVVGEIKKFAKEIFDLEEILSTANQLKYTKGIKRVFAEEWQNPSEEFVKHFASKVYDGRLTQSAKEQFTGLTKQAFHEFVQDMFSRRLSSALSADSSSSVGEVEPYEEIAEEITEEKGIVTTEEEIEGYHAVKSILREVVSPSRVFMRDTLSYCGILLDDNNRKPICRLFFNTSKKSIGLFDAEKNISKENIESIDDIYKFAEALKTTALGYDQGSPGVSEESAENNGNAEA